MWIELKKAIAIASGVIKRKIKMIALKGRDMAEHHSTRLKIWKRDQEFRKYVRKIRSAHSLPTISEYRDILNAYDWEMKYREEEEGASPSLKWHKKYDPLYAHIVSIARIPSSKSSGMKPGCGHYLILLNMLTPSFGSLLACLSVFLDAE